MPILWQHYTNAYEPLSLAILVLFATLCFLVALEAICFLKERQPCLEPLNSLLTYEPTIAVARYPLPFAAGLEAIFAHQ